MTIEEKQFVEIELWNPNVTFRQLKDGNLYKLGFEVTPEVWKLFEQPTPGLRLKGILYVAQDDGSDEVELQQAKANVTEAEPEIKGPYAAAWASLGKSGFFDLRPIKEYVRAMRLSHQATSDKKAWCAEFEVESRSFISMDALRAVLRRDLCDCTSNELSQIETLIAQARRVNDNTQVNGAGA